MRAELERQLEDMQKQGIIEESNSVWHSPVVMVKKPNNEWRFCVDYRKLNAVTEPMSFPIPHMSDVFDTLAQSKAEIFSTLDLRSGFWQVPLHKDTKHKSAFITHQGIFEFNRLSFGMVNAPMTFQSLMTKVLKNLNFKIALVYIDDLLIFSKDFDQHLHHLNLVFDNLRSANLTLHPSKCKFATKQVKYLGHIVSKDGLRVNPENTDKIRNCQSPTNVKQVRSALGMMGYYRKFVKDYAKIAQPLNNLFKKDTKFNWTEDCEQAFNVLKTKLIEAPILRYPKFEDEFVLSVDSSDYSIGYVLTQEHDGKQHPICFGGRALRENELKWHITDKEGLALVEGIQHFKHYLANSKFTVFTDNVSVKYLQKIKDCQGRLGRWGILLQGYSFEIKHKSSLQNCTADFLSRQKYKDSDPVESHELADHIYSLETPKQLTQVTLVYPGETDAEVLITDTADAEVLDLPDKDRDISVGIAIYQQECPELKHIYQYLAQRQVPEDPQLARTVVAESYNYELEDGVLKHFYTRRCKQVPMEERLVKQTAIPRCLRDELLKSYHDCIAGGGHQGFERTYAALRNKYYWPSMYENIRQYVKTCEVCQQSKRAFNAKPPPLHPQPVDDVFGRWQMDILSGLPTTKDKYKHILVLVDSYSKWVELFPLRTQEATEVASVLFREIISRYGAPRSILSDRGKNFMSNLVKALSELFEIKRHFTSPYHPMGNGLTEVKNSYILQALRAYCKGQQDDWPEILPGIMMAYRSTPATQSTQYSPFFMLYGREMRLPIDTVLQPKEHLPQNYKVYLSRILQNLEVCRKLAGDNIKAAQVKYKHQYDKKTKEPDFRPAQRVWLYCTKVPVGKAPKLHRKWVGPYYITMLGPNYTYKLRHCATNKEVKSLVNAMRLKPYFDPEDRPTNPPDPLLDNEEQLDPEELEQNLNKDAENETRASQTERNEANRDRAENERRSSQKNNPRETNRELQENRSTEQTQQKSVINTDDNQRPVKGKLNKTLQLREATKANGQTEEKKIKYRNERQLNKPDRGRTDNQSIGRTHELNNGRQKTEQWSQNKNKDDLNKQSNAKGQRKSGYSNMNKNQNANKVGNSQKGIGIQHKSETKKQKLSSKLSDKTNLSQKPKDSKQSLQPKHSDPKVQQQSSKQNQTKDNRIPSCKDCKTGHCKLLDQTQIKSIAASQRSNGALYYKVKWNDGTSDWYFPCKIPNHMIREYHANRTMSGKKRKKPLHDKQHKFFTETQQNVNMVQTDSTNGDTFQVNQNKTRLLGMRLINGKPYYLIQKGTTTPEWQTVAVAHWYARDLLEFLIEDRNKEDERGMINGIRMKRQGFVPRRPELDDPHWEQINEIQIKEDGSYHCLVVYRNPELAPEWVLLEEAALGNKYDLVKILKRDYHAVVKVNQAY